VSLQSRRRANATTRPHFEPLRADDSGHDDSDGCEDPASPSDEKPVPSPPCGLEGLDPSVRGVDTRRVRIGLGDANEFGQLLDDRRLGSSVIPGHRCLRDAGGTLEMLG